MALNNNITNLIKAAQDGDKQAQEEIISSNIGLVWSVVRKFANRGHDLEDLFQIGCIGIMKAIKNFDTEFEVKFSTYAVPMIMGEIKRFLRDDGMIKVSRHLKELASKAKITKDILANELGYEPKISEIALRLGEEVEELAVALEANSVPESIYKTVNEGDKSPIFLIDKIVSEQHGECEIIDKISLGQAMNALEKREKSIIILRYYKGKTQSEIARLLGISQVQVSRLEKKILKRMKDLIV